MHDSMLKLAMKDAYNQQDLAQKAKLQVELFQKAQDFAKEVGIQEMKAKQFSHILNEATKRAQASRMMMFQAANQVRVLADRTLRAISPIKCVSPHCPPSLIPPHISNAISSNIYAMRQEINELSPYEPSQLVNSSQILDYTLP
jgi:hypothetical protein